MDNKTLIKLKPFLYGKLLGDGCLEKTKKASFNSRLKIKHKVEHKEYVEQCYKKIHNFSNKLYLDSSVKIYKGIQKRHYSWCFKSKALPVFTELRKIWYKNTKVLPDDLEQFFTIETLAYWYMDDGYIQVSGKYVRSVFCTDSFTEFEVDRLVNILNTYNLNAVKVKYKNCFRIEIRKLENVQKLINLISDYVPNCLQYKLRTQQ